MESIHKVVNVISTKGKHFSSTVESILCSIRYYYIFYIIISGENEEFWEEIEKQQNEEGFYYELGFILDNIAFREDIIQQIQNFDNETDLSSLPVNDLASHVAYSYSILRENNNHIQEYNQNATDIITLFSPLPNVSTTMTNNSFADPLWNEILDKVCCKINGKYGV